MMSPHLCFCLDQLQVLSCLQWGWICSPRHQSMPKRMPSCPLSPDQHRTGPIPGPLTGIHLAPPLLHLHSVHPQKLQRWKGSCTTFSLTKRSASTASSMKTLTCGTWTLCQASCWGEPITVETTCTNTQSSVSCQCDYRTIVKNIYIFSFLFLIKTKKTALSGLFLLLCFQDYRISPM